jgi:hypothetical protein
MATTRTIYIAFGTCADGARDGVVSVLKQFDEALRRGETPAEAAAVFDGACRPLAERAAQAVRRFEAVTGGESGAEVIQVSTPADPKAIAVQNRGASLFGPDASDAADVAARALARLLAALGLAAVTYSTVD